MYGKPTRNRLRHCFSVERCEPRQMLSVVPVAAAQAEFVGQTFEVRLISGTIISVDLPSTFNRVSGVAAGNGPSIGGYIALIPDSAGNAITTRNAFGSLYVVPDFAAVPAGRTEVFSNWNDGYMPWQATLVPVLDPILPQQSSLLLLHLPASGPVFAPVSISFSTSIGAAVPVFAPFAGSTATTVPSSTTNGVGDVASPRWLSATFSPAEQHRLDTSTADVPSKAGLVIRDSQSRLALEPTRLTAQTFCVVASAQLSTQTDGSERAVKSATGQPENRADKVQFRSQPQGQLRKAEARLGPTLPSPLAAVNDAAILAWVSLPQSLQHSSIAAVRDQAPNLVTQESDNEGGQELAAADSQPWQVAAQFLNERNRLIGTVLTTVAIQSLWSYGNNDAQETQPPRVPRERVRKHLILSLDRK